MQFSVCVFAVISKYAKRYSLHKGYNAYYIFIS